MKVSAFAASRGVSKQFCYQQVKSAGKSISDYTDSRGDLSPEGIALLESLIPDKTESEEKTDIPVKKKSAYDQLLEDNRELVKSVNKLTDSLTESNKRVGELTAALAQAQDNLAREQAIHGDLRLEYNELKKKLAAGSPESIVMDPVPADGEEDPSQETEESSADQKQDSHQKEDKPVPEGESLEEKKQDPEKREGESAPADPSSSPVTDNQKQRLEEKPKATLKERLRFLFTGIKQS